MHSPTRELLQATGTEAGNGVGGVYGFLIPIASGRAFNSVTYQSRIRCLYMVQQHVLIKRADAISCVIGREEDLAIGEHAV